MPIDRAQLPINCLLTTQGMPHDYRDCFAVDLPMAIQLEAYIAAFYTTWLFKLERIFLGLAGHPSTDQQAIDLAQGQLQAYAAWTLDARQPDQILMRDITGVTCLWLMAVSSASGTRLYLGSGVKAMQCRADGSMALPFGYRALMGLHVLYSKALLATTASKLARH